MVKIRWCTGVKRSQVLLHRPSRILSGENLKFDCRQSSRSSWSSVHRTHTRQACWWVLSHSHSRQPPPTLPTYWTFKLRGATHHHPPATLGRILPFGTAKNLIVNHQVWSEPPPPSQSHLRFHLHQPFDLSGNVLFKSSIIIVIFRLLSLV